MWTFEPSFSLRLIAAYVPETTSSPAFTPLLTSIHVLSAIPVSTGCIRTAWSALMKTTRWSCSRCRRAASFSDSHGKFVARLVLRILRLLLLQGLGREPSLAPHGHALDRHHDHVGDSLRLDVGGGAHARA